MTEREAKGLAAELDSHRWWRVTGVQCIIPATIGSQWVVIVRHRRVPALAVGAVYDSWPELADKMMAAGEREAQRQQGQGVVRYTWQDPERAVYTTFPDARLAERFVLGVGVEP